ncbi:hypothetical protein ASE92_20115 [Pedobacter sp. Leaf41]|uniref:hypothetical protein n=1 Tax=Pedobacter sp. Leaf41 TaxID=1736218 RepID=UPI000703744B|nr:hypothetical protein [Pedobacter sp. Leaf41]KQN37244.1 hypothetical protein ASE92_20115 [Pedobacter sp. Leaf41]
MGKYLIIIVLFLSPFVGYSAIKLIETKDKSDSTKKQDDTSKVNNQIGDQKAIDSTDQGDPATNIKDVQNPDKSMDSKADVTYENYLSLKHLLFYSMTCLLGVVTTWFINRKSYKDKSNQYKNKIRSLENEVNSLTFRQNKGSNLLNRNEINTKQINLSEAGSEEISLPIELSVDNQILTINNAESRLLYFPNPNLDGNFRSSEGKEVFTEGASVYKFTLMDETNANVEFCDNLSSVTIALNNRNEMILSLATETNPYNPNASKIIIVDNKKAKAQLEGNIWLIKEKAKVKYV